MIKTISIYGFSAFLVQASVFFLHLVLSTKLPSDQYSGISIIETLIMLLITFFLMNADRIYAREIVDKGLAKAKSNFFCYLLINFLVTVPVWLVALSYFLNLTSSIITMALISALGLAVIMLALIEFQVKGDPKAYFLLRFFRVVILIFGSLFFTLQYLDDLAGFVLVMLVSSVLPILLISRKYISVSSISFEYITHIYAECIRLAPIIFISWFMIYGIRFLILDIFGASDMATYTVHHRFAQIIGFGNLVLIGALNPKICVSVKRVDFSSSKYLHLYVPLSLAFFTVIGIVLFFLTKVSFEFFYEQKYIFDAKLMSLMILLEVISASLSLVIATLLVALEKSQTISASSIQGFLFTGILFYLSFYVFDFQLPIHSAVGFLICCVVGVLLLLLRTLGSLNMILYVILAAVPLLCLSGSFSLLVNIMISISAMMIGLMMYFSYWFNGVRK